MYLSDTEFEQELAQKTALCEKVLDERIPAPKDLKGDDVCADVVVDARTLAVYVPCALVLVRRRRAAPQEAVRKSHGNHLLLSIVLYR